MGESKMDKRTTGSRTYLLGRLQVQDRALTELRAQIADLEAEAGTLANRLEVSQDEQRVCAGRLRKTATRSRRFWKLLQACRRREC